MEKEIEKIKKERDEYLQGWKRAKADFLNYKKEEGARMGVMAEYAERELLLKVLPILDNLERAAKPAESPRQDVPTSGGDNQAGPPQSSEAGLGGEEKKKIYEGIQQILSQWQEFLKNQGVEEIESVGKPFNPEVHEAIQEAEGKESGMVVEEVEKGYTMHGRLLRPAKVKVVK